MRSPMTMLLLYKWSNDDAVVVQVVQACVAMHNICCVAESEWDLNQYNMWIESCPAPVGVNDYNFDNNEYERDIARTSPAKAAKNARQQASSNLPPLPVNHRTGF